MCMYMYMYMYYYYECWSISWPWPAMHNIMSALLLTYCMHALFAMATCMQLLYIGWLHAGAFTKWNQVFEI